MERAARWPPSAPTPQPGYPCAGNQGLSPNPLATWGPQPELSSGVTGRVKSRAPRVAYIRRFQNAHSTTLQPQAWGQAGSRQRHGDACSSHHPQQTPPHLLLCFLSSCSFPVACQFSHGHVRNLCTEQHSRAATILRAPCSLLWPSWSEQHGELLLGVLDKSSWWDILGWGSENSGCLHPLPVTPVTCVGLRRGKEEDLAGPCHTEGVGRAQAFSL